MYFVSMLEWTLFLAGVQNVKFSQNFSFLERNSSFTNLSVTLSYTSPNYYLFGL